MGTYTLAGWWRRFTGFLIDAVIVTALASLLHVIGAILAAAYWIFFVGYPGNATIGMRALGMRVVPADNRPTLTYMDALVRWLMMIVSGVCLDLGYLWAAWDPRRQTWHDKVARTLVVRV
jgi:uncharacterized RDD family membrane protein YckC